MIQVRLRNLKLKNFSIYQKVRNKVHLNAVEELEDTYHFFQAFFFHLYTLPNVSFLPFSLIIFEM